MWCTGTRNGLALTLDVHRPAHPNGAGLISIVSGGWQSSVEMAQKKIAKAHPQLGRHLETAVRTGTFCLYQPERPVDRHF
jgi:hypothetical protein